MRTRTPSTIVDRTLKFLKDIHHQLKRDPQPRALYTAMTYHLSPTTLIAAKRMGILRRAGWNWYWMVGRPDKEMATQLHEEQVKLSRKYTANYRRYRRTHGRVHKQ